MLVIFVLAWIASLTATSVLQASVHDTLPTSKEINDPSVQVIKKGKEIDKRQPPAVLDRYLSATFSFHCPEGGNMERVFDWSAVYKPATREIELFAVHNIDGIEPLEIEGNTFATHWHGTWCEHEAFRLCYYKAYARTEGSASAQGIVMSIVVNTNIVGDDPTIHQWCVSATRAPPNETCVKSHLVGSYGPCRITNISVEVN